MKTGSLVKILGNEVKGKKADIILTVDGYCESYGRGEDDMGYITIIEDVVYNTPLSELISEEPFKGSIKIDSDIAKIGLSNDDVLYIKSDFVIGVRKEVNSPITYHSVDYEKVKREFGYRLDSHIYSFKYESLEDIIGKKLGFPVRKMNQEEVIWYEIKPDFIFKYNDKEYSYINASINEVELFKRSQRFHEDMISLVNKYKDDKELIGHIQKLFRDSFRMDKLKSKLNTLKQFNIEDFIGGFLPLYDMKEKYIKNMEDIFKIEKGYKYIIPDFYKEYMELYNKKVAPYKVILLLTKSKYIDSNYYTVVRRSGVTEIKVPDKYKGIVIGKKGGNIKRIQREYGVRLKVV